MQVFRSVVFSAKFLVIVLLCGRNVGFSSLITVEDGGSGAESAQSSVINDHNESENITSTEDATESPSYQNTLSGEYSDTQPSNIATISTSTESIIGTPEDVSTTTEYSNGRIENRKYGSSDNGKSITTLASTSSSANATTRRTDTTTQNLAAIFPNSNVIIFETPNNSITTSSDLSTTPVSPTTAVPTTTEVPTTTAAPTTTQEPCFTPDSINVTVTSVTKHEAFFNITIPENTGRTICTTGIFISCDAKQNNTLWPWVKVLRNVSIELNDTNTHPVNITDLSPFTNYTCTNNGTLFPVFHFHTSEEVPNAPTNLSVNVLSSSNSNISWKEPEIIPSILKVYQVNITRIGVANVSHIWRNCSKKEVFTYNLTETSFLFNDSLADFNYTVTVEALSSAGYGASSSTSFVTPPKAPSAPKLVGYSLTKKKYYHNNINFTQWINWTMPCDTYGPVENIHVGIIGYYIPDPSIPKKYNYTIPISDKVNYSYPIPNIPAAMNFTVQIFVEGKVKGSEVDTGVFITEDNYPSAPKENKTIINSRNFTIIWQKPTNYPGEITNYTINITGQGVNWPETEYCNVSDAKYNFIVNSSAAEYFNPRVLPGATYLIQLSAYTSIGQGNLTSRNVTSEMSNPDRLSVSNHFSNYSNPEVYNETVTIKFVPGCFNGRFDAYEISFLGIRGNQTHQGSDRIKVYDNTEYTFPLKPEYFYTVKVTVWNEHFSNTSNLSFTSPAGVPTFDTKFSSKLSITPGQTESTLTLKKDYFDSSQGDVRYLAIIVSDRNITGGDFSEWNDMEWPIPKGNSSVYYQATPKHWNPFAQIDSVEFPLGANQSCADDEQFCNKPLEPGTEYFLFVRVFNDKYYRNSMPISFVTEKVGRVGLILGLLFGILCVILSGFLIFVMWRRGIIKFRNSAESKIPGPGPKTEIPKKKFIEYCKYLERNPDVVKAQWTELDIQSKQIYEELPCYFSTISENKRKNRYTNILPFDHSRVRLNIDEDDDICSDYINASHIKGFSNENEYIATQGPLPETCRDFWKMILQEQVSIIVMVSRFIENNRDKCYKYFPDNRETMTIDGDDMEVRCSTELHFGFHCIRTLQVKKDLRQVTVTHMQFLEWPDFGVPSSTESMLHFCQQFKDRWANEGGMAVIHCSAGVGRTGTLIATDILFRALNAGRDIDVFNTVLELRRQRRNMVQTEKQYMYIHQLIRSMLECPVTDEDDNQEHVYENIELKNINEVEIVESSF